MKKTINLRKILLLVAFIELCATGIVNAQALKVRSDRKIIHIDPENLSMSSNNSDMYRLAFGKGNDTQNAGRNYGLWNIVVWQKGLQFTIPFPTSYSGTGVRIDSLSNVGFNIFSPKERLDVNGNIAINGIVKVSSDKRLKKDILPLDAHVSQLANLNSIRYKSNPVIKSKDDFIKQFGSDTIDNYQYQMEVSMNESKKQFIEKDTVIRYGFIAQELRDIYPELVFEDSEGYLSVDYIGMIPVLVEAIKEQQKQIDALINGKDFEKSGTVLTSEAKLYQNNPNPFTANTEIKYYLPNETKNASLRIYNLVGEEIAKFDLLDRGYANLTINGSVLKAGMYNYALLVDGQLIDTKQMVLTK